MVLEGGVITSTLVNNTSETIVSDIQNVSSSIFNNILGTLKPFLAVIGGLIGLYAIYLIIKLILAFIQNKKINKTLENTELILTRLERIERKVDKKKDTRIERR